MKAEEFRDGRVDADIYIAKVVNRIHLEERTYICQIVVD